MTDISDLIARWNTAEGRPYKGSLIDMDAYKKAPDNIGCMSPQGQVLHLIAGWSIARLCSSLQVEADSAVAEILNISRAHSVLLRAASYSVGGAPATVLTNPETILGGQWSTLLDFWWYMDGMRRKQWAAVKSTADHVAKLDLWDAAKSAAKASVGINAWAYARLATREAALTAPIGTGTANTAAHASEEIQGIEFLRRYAKPLSFLPAFGFASPDDIPARPANYGQ